MTEIKILEPSEMVLNPRWQAEVERLTDLLPLKRLSAETFKPSPVLSLAGSIAAPHGVLRHLPSQLPDQAARQLPDSIDNYPGLMLQSSEYQPCGELIGLAHLYSAH